MAVHAFWAAGRELRPAPDARGRAQAEPFRGLLYRCAPNNASIRRRRAAGSAAATPVRALLVAAALGEDVPALLDERDVARERLTFDPRFKGMTTVDRERDGMRWLHTKGALLELLARCAFVRTPDGDRPIDPAARAEIEASVRAVRGQGLRVLGFAEHRSEAALPPPIGIVAELDLTFLGLAALADPPRPEVADAVSACRRAGIRIIVITGDHGLTAMAVARQVGIVNERAQVVHGAELDAMEETELEALLRDESELIVACSSPETKLRVVDALRAAGYTVAMTTW